MPLLPFKLPATFSKMSSKAADKSTCSLKWKPHNAPSTLCKLKFYSVQNYNAREKVRGSSPQYEPLNSLLLSMHLLMLKQIFEHSKEKESIKETSALLLWKAPGRTNFIQRISHHNSINLIIHVSIMTLMVILSLLCWPLTFRAIRQSYLELLSG